MKKLHYSIEFYNELFNCNCFNESGDIRDGYEVIFTIDSELSSIYKQIGNEDHAHTVMNLIGDLVYRNGLCSKIKRNNDCSTGINKEFYNVCSIYWVRLLFLNYNLENFINKDSTVIRWDIEYLQPKYFASVINEVMKITPFVKLFDIDKHSKRDYKYVDYTVNNYVWSKEKGFPLSRLLEIICQSIMGRFIMEGDLSYDELIIIIDEEMENLNMLVSDKKCYCYNYLILRNVYIENNVDIGNRKLLKINNTDLFNFLSGNKKSEESLFCYMQRYTYQISSEHNNLHEVSWVGNINRERALSEILFSIVLQCGSIGNSFFLREFHIANSVSLPYGTTLNSYNNNPLYAPGTSKMTMSHDVFYNCEFDNPHTAIVLSRLKSCILSESSESKLINIVVLWETLLGANSEISFKIALSIATILTKYNQKTLKENHDYIKKIYKIRSEIIHGVTDTLDTYRGLVDEIAEIEKITFTVLKHICDSGDLGKSTLDRLNNIIFSI